MRNGLRPSALSTMTAFALMMATWAAPPADAQLILEFNSLLNGAAPVGGSPWLRATFTTVAAGTVDLKLENLLPSGEFVDDWGFNVDPSLTAGLGGNGLPGMTVTQLSGAGIHPFGSGSVIGVDASNGGANMKAGLFDLVFGWPTPAAERFPGGSTATFQIAGAGLTENAFYFETAADSHMFGGPYYSAAHIQGIPTGKSGSIYGVRVIPQSDVPEPGAWALFAGAVVPAAVLFRRRRKSRTH